MAENNGSKNEEYFSKVVRAGKRTYFFDVKSTKKGEHYLTITESKRKFNNDQGKFFYEKFKIFLYKEDFGKFTSALEETLGHIVAHNDELLNDEDDFAAEKVQPSDNGKDNGISLESNVIDTSLHTNIDFEDLGKETEKVEEKDNGLKR